MVWRMDWYQVFEMGFEHQKIHQLLPSEHLPPVGEDLGLGSWELKGDSLWEVYHSEIQSTGLHQLSLVFCESYKSCCTADSHFFWEVLEW